MFIATIRYLIYLIPTKVWDFLGSILFAAMFASMILGGMIIA